MSRVVILGMDGLDPDLIEKFIDELPNFRKLMERGTFTRTDSVFPPDSIPAWATIYTGMMPDYHGILDSIDYLDIKNKNLKCDTSGLQGKTFWDAAGEQGKRVCIINPFLAYPVWPVNGAFINGPVFVSGDQQAYPEELKNDFEIPEMGGIVDSPTKKTLGEFGEKTRVLTANHLEFCKDIYKREKWDVFFMNFLAMDRVQHVFWRYYDNEDPTYPGKNPHSEVVPEFYKLHDRIAGEFLELIDDDTILLILSDHGHGRRCTKALFVNELLRQKGLLKSNVKRSKLDPKYMLERVKLFVLRTLDKYDLQDLSFTIGKLVPGAKSLKKSTFVIDNKKSTAGVARFSGMNPFGGIDLPRDKFDMDDQAYESMRDEIIKDLIELKDPKTGKKIVKWAMRREEMFTGPHADIFPELIFHLDFEYGVSRSLFGPLVDVNPTHRKISGGHMPQAVLFSSKKLDMNKETIPSILSIAPTVLNLVGANIPEHMTGQALSTSEDK